MSWLHSRPFGIWILVVIFGWRCLKSLELLTRGDRVTDSVLFRLIDAGYMHSALLVAILVAHAAALWGLFRPAPVWFWVAVVALSLWVAEHIIAHVAALRHPEQAREAFRISRISRGLHAPEGALDLAVNPTLSLVLLLVCLALSVIWFVLLVSNRSHFL